ncbi:mitochondrial transcription termination factor family protein [Tasmannia lanceolata]|uniref:mitochondrial transcription termination factor family protein n=1 Tax=Tasmannia lanceolata TaxID=3420 RepID=UPI004062942E
MHFPFSSSTSTLLNSIIIRRSLHTLPGLKKVYYRHRARAQLEAQQALTEYLHSTRCLTFTHAEHISKNSPSSLSALLSKINLPPSNFFKSVQRFLSYHPINEYEFFFESIGLLPNEIPNFLPTHRFFLHEDVNLLPAIRVLVEFGFPWNKLGKLYKEERSIFDEDSGVLKERLRGFELLGFDRVSVIGICLNFSFVLGKNEELGGEIDGLFVDLNRVFIDFGLMVSLEWNVDVCYEVCRKIRVFYDLGCEKGKMGELIGRNQNIFIEFSEEVLVRTTDFFCRFRTRKEDVGMLILQCPEILNFDLEKPVIKVFDFLKHVGLSDVELNSIMIQYPYVFGMNKMKNLPQLMRALDLHNWFFDKIKNGNHHLLDGFVNSSFDKELEEEVRDGIERIKSNPKPHHTNGKFDFLLGIGFGMNRNTLEILPRMHGTMSQLNERFDCLLRMGIEFSKLCKMINDSPKILNQSTQMLEQKVNFLCKDLHCTLQHLETFPTYLWYNLETRMKTRYRILTWLKEKGLYRGQYTLATVAASSEKRFIRFLRKIHPAAPKLWLESVSFENHINSNKET